MSEMVVNSNDACVLVTRVFTVVINTTVVIDCFSPVMVIHVCDEAKNREFSFLYSLSVL